MQNSPRRIFRPSTDTFPTVNLLLTFTSSPPLQTQLPFLLLSPQHNFSPTFLHIPQHPHSITPRLNFLPSSSSLHPLHTTLGPDPLPLLLLNSCLTSAELSEWLQCGLGAGGGRSEGKVSKRLVVILASLVAVMSTGSPSIVTQSWIIETETGDLLP